MKFWCHGTFNVYSTPADSRQTFIALFEKACKIAGDSPLLIVGHFNAAHPDWSYGYLHTKGIALATQIAHHRLTLLTEPAFPTHTGNPVTRDTTPDLALVRNIRNSTWINTQVNLGSDHYICSIALAASSRPPCKFKVVDWDHFRTLRKQDENTYTSLRDQFARLQEDVTKVTKERETTRDVERMDNRLAHLIEAQQALQAKWKTQKLTAVFAKRE